MIRAMYAGISGLKVNQSKLDIVGNNIANVNTTAYKCQRVRFQDTLSQNVSDATGPGANLGGTNPRQVGLGVQIAGIDSVVTQGNMQPTSGNLDFAVDGEGYFVVGRGGNNQKINVFSPDDTTNVPNTVDATNSDMSISFTRDGSFTLDSDGNLLTSDGYRVMGYVLTDSNGNPSISHGTNVTDKTTYNFVDAEDAANLTAAASSSGSGVDLVPLGIPDTVLDSDGNSIKIKSFSVDSNGVIKAVLDNNKITALGQIAMVSFRNPEGLSKAGKNLCEKTSNSGDAVFRTAVGTASDVSNEGTYGDIRQGMLEMSNVDLAEQFTDMIVASRAFQANGKIITTSDEILQDLVNLKR